MLPLGSVRMVHVFGGPHREVMCVQNGQAIFIEWPLSGLIRIVVKTGQLWDNRKSPWSMHPDDLRRITRKADPYNTDLGQRPTRPPLSSIEVVPHSHRLHPFGCSPGLPSHYPAVRSAEAPAGLSHVRKPGQRK